MEKEYNRKEAIFRHLSGEPVARICRDLSVSRKWFYKWWCCYQTDKEDWYQDKSRAPKTIPNKIDQAMEQLILSVRDNLEKTPYAQKGAATIAWRINKLGYTPPPSWTINRVLKRNGRIHPETKKERKRGRTNYPYFIEAYHAGHIHQADLVGPRYIRGDGRLYAFNTIDVFSHEGFSVVVRSKDCDTMIQAIVDTWKHLGVPIILQLDNELSFRGSNRYPHSLGKVIKLCLTMNVELVFIPPAEPWRNGMIERFNNTFDKRFYRTEQFKDCEHLRNSLRQFIEYHNANHIYSANGGKTPSQVLNSVAIKPEKLTPNYQLPDELNIPYEGYIHLIRLIRSDLKLNVWGELFSMPKKVMYEYVRATIYTEYHLLNVFLGDELVAQFEYTLPTLNQWDPQDLIRELFEHMQAFGINIKSDE